MPTPQLHTPSPYLEAQSGSLSNAETSSTARPASPNVEHHGCNPAWPSFELENKTTEAVQTLSRLTILPPIVEEIQSHDLSLKSPLPISHGGLHTPNITSTSTLPWAVDANTWNQSFQLNGYNAPFTGSHRIFDGWPPYSIDGALHSPSNIMDPIDTKQSQPASNLAGMPRLPIPIELGDYSDYNQVAQSVQSGDNSAMLGTGSFVPLQSAPPMPLANASNRNSQCAICGLMFTRSADLGRHHESVHQRKRHDCHYPGCSNRRGKGWSRADKLRSHQKENHGFF
ncbi:hypothetical protein BP6252_12815 [Coleophoma cylindrospora]|uniref:C2H2-type domain-containing protein n=1 Tax=Coleophoma cylindrospora TaxID=1849047 RepID=A0A3D8QDM9_9HELO|nr:hypothetical protein BP6252_12815 [Coleophoma cylindrospora]